MHRHNVSPRSHNCCLSWLSLPSSKLLFYKDVSKFRKNIAFSRKVAFYICSTFRSVAREPSNRLLSFFFCRTIYDFMFGKWDVLDCAESTILDKWMVISLWRSAISLDRVIACMTLRHFIEIITAASAQPRKCSIVTRSFSSWEDRVWVQDYRKHCSS